MKDGREKKIHKKLRGIEVNRLETRAEFISRLDFHRLVAKAGEWYLLFFLLLLSQFIGK